MAEHEQTDRHQAAQEKTSVTMHATIQQIKDWQRVPGHAGLYARTNGTYSIRFRDKGIWTSMAAGRNLAEAKSALYDARRRAQRGTTGVRDDGCRLEQLQDDYIRYSARRLAPKTISSYRSALGRILRGVMADRVCNLTPAVVEHYLADRLDHVSGGSLNAELIVLRAMLKFGVRQGLTASNPLAEFQMLSAKAVKPKRALTADEFERLLDHKHSTGGGGSHRHHLRRPCGMTDLWLLLGHTGMRIGELRALDWPDVELNCRRIHVRGTKSDAGDRWIPMSDRLYDMLERLHDEHDLATSGPVMRTKNGTRRKSGANKSFAACLRAVRWFDAAEDGLLDLNCHDDYARLMDTPGIDPRGLTLHSFRRSFATWLIQGGESPKTVQQLLGHATLELTLQVYAQVLPGDAVRAIGRLPGEASRADTSRQAEPKPAHNRHTRPTGFLPAAAIDNAGAR